MEQVDFDYVGRGGNTIYSTCFQPLMTARCDLRKPEADCLKLILATEELFDFLVNEGNKYGFNVDEILEIPDLTGSTCFLMALQLSKHISDYIIGREIKVNTITTHMVVPGFHYPDLTISMMVKGVNPHVIEQSGNIQRDIFPLSFESKEAKLLMATFPRSIHFSIEDIHCSEDCPPNCPSNFRRFYFKNGAFVTMADENQIGHGGFGSVFKGSFHGKEKAVKCVLIGQIDNHSIFARDAVSDLEKNISEIRIQMASGGCGIIVPEGFVRQQNQEQDKNGNWIAVNYNIFIYPLYDCNLYELHAKHYSQFTDELIRDICLQCLTRKRSNRQRIRILYQRIVRYDTPLFVELGL